MNKGNPSIANVRCPQQARTVDIRRLHEYHYTERHKSMPKQHEVSERLDGKQSGQRGRLSAETAGIVDLMRHGYGLREHVNLLVGYNRCANFAKPADKRTWQ